MLKGQRPQTYTVGSKGKGVRVGIIDTGVDFTHPYWAAASFDGFRAAEPKDEPMDACNGHGTHIAARLGVYRIMGCKSVANSEVFLAAMERAAQHDMQVINLSLGFKNHWPNSPEASIAQKLFERGVIVVASAGNDGKSGLFNINSPAIAPGVIAVAAVDSQVLWANTFRLSNDKDQIEKDPSIITGCTPFSGNFRNAFILLFRGGCDFSVKVNNAQAAGASGVIIHDTLPMIMVAVDTGDQLREYLQDSSVPTIVWRKERRRLSNSNSDSPSETSSWGPSIDPTRIKPEISATGGFIYSTYPTKLGGWTTLSGTSMAAPHISGLAAGMVASSFATMERKDISRAFRDAILQTGTLVKTPGWMDDVIADGTVYSGAGRLRPKDPNYANYNDVRVIEPFRALPPTNDENRVYKLKLGIEFNNASGKVTLKHLPAMTVDNWNNKVITNTVRFGEQYATVELSETKFPSRALESAGLDPKQFYIYSGYIQITIDDNLHHRHISLVLWYKRCDPVIQRDDTYPMVIQIDANRKTRPQITSSPVITSGQGVQFGFRQILDGKTDKVLGYIPNLNAFRLDKSVPGGVGTDSIVWNGNIQRDATFLNITGPVTPLPLGRYRVRFFFCKMFGNPTIESEYETWTSPVITVIKSNHIVLDRYGTDLVVGKPDSNIATIM
ncbi:peptidase S8/S53 domain-containing protein [Syncephalis plumigaleata]|nr:peptidase S8/S53 domain-containing protein [Syncephalis plumigaleata]